MNEEVKMVVGKIAGLFGVSEKALVGSAVDGPEATARAFAWFVMRRRLALPVGMVAESFERPEANIDGGAREIARRLKKEPELRAKLAAFDEAFGLSGLGRVWAWWGLRQWRERRLLLAARATNAELIELDAFRRLVKLEKILEANPSDVAALAEANEAYRVTGQDGNRLTVMRWLRDIPPPDETKPKGRPIGTVDPKREEGREAELLKRARMLKEELGEVTISDLQRRLGVGYNRAALLADELKEW